MYNAEIKEAYLIEKKGGTATQTKAIFEAASKFENHYEKDLAEFSLPELAEFMESFGFPEVEIVRTRKGLISSYADWYDVRNKTVHSIRDYDIFSFPYKDLFAPTLTLSAEQLINRITQIHSLDSAQPVIPALCLAWLGVDSGVAVKMKKEQIDTKAGVIYDATGNVILHSMPECIREALHIYANTREAIRIQNQTFTVYAEDIGYFIRRFKTLNSKKAPGPYSTTQIATCIRELGDKFGKAFGNQNAIWATYTNVQRSGNFYRLYQMEQAGTDVFSVKNADKVRLCLGKSKRNHKDNMCLYKAYKQIREESKI